MVCGRYRVPFGNGGPFPQWGPLSRLSFRLFYRFVFGRAPWRGDTARPQSRVASCVIFGELHGRALQPTRGFLRCGLMFKVRLDVS